MAVDPKYQPDVDAILARRLDQGADDWTDPDRQPMKGGAFCALQSAHMLLELGVEPTDPALQRVAALFWDAWREDGGFKLWRREAVQPCHTIHAANLLCQLGYGDDLCLGITFEHLLSIQQPDGGWRCSKFFYGHGPETECSNPGPTLAALNAFRFTGYLNREPALDGAVEFLLGHWTTRAPLGPCHYGIGARFMQVEYPLAVYNLFSYVYILSFYEAARTDARFLEALGVLRSKLKDGQIVVERVNRRLSGLSFCKKGAPSELATRRYGEVEENMRGVGG